MILKDYSLLTDENIHSKIVEHLRSKNFAVFDIKEQNLQGISDK